MGGPSPAILWTAYVACTIWLRPPLVNSQALIPAEAPNTIPALPATHHHNKTCRLDLSDELFGGVKEACGQPNTLDRSRCCPVLAAWLFAAHARTALQSAAPPSSSPTDEYPVRPDDSQTCVDALQDSLHTRRVHIPRPNATCDAIICFCGIRLHHLTSLSCAAAFNLTAAHHNAAIPTSAVRALESNCADSSYRGCTKCLNTLDKLKGKKRELFRQKKQYKWQRL